MYKLYCLITSETGSVFYIGITKRILKERFQSHIWSSHCKLGGKWKFTTHKSKHIRKLDMLGKKIEIFGLLESVDKTYIENAER